MHAAKLQPGFASSTPARDQPEIPATAGIPVGLESVRNLTEYILIVLHPCRSEPRSGADGLRRTRLGRTAGFGQRLRGSASRRRRHNVARSPSSPCPRSFILVRTTAGVVAAAADVTFSGDSVAKVWRHPCSSAPRARRWLPDRIQKDVRVPDASTKAARGWPGPISAHICDCPPPGAL